MSATTANPATFQTGHIGLNVTDIERSRAFYQSIFGFSVVRESADADRRFVFLGDETRLVLTLWQQAEGKFAPTQAGLHHLSFQVNSMDEVHAAETRVKEAGVRLYHGGIVPHAEGAQSGGIFFEDPDGTRLEIFAPSGVTETEAPFAAAPTCGFF